MEKILKIKETSFGYELYSAYNSSKYSNCYDGFEIITNKQIIKLGITNSQSCCENWGYFMTCDPIKFFEGAILYDIKLTDTALDTKQLEAKEIIEANLMFVTLETSEGTLQFVAYNEHNGYYGHEAIVISEQLYHTETL